MGLMAHYNSKYNSKEIKRITGLAKNAAKLDAQELASDYADLRASAPPPRMNYFMETHTGIPGTKDKSNRNEDHLALALWNDRKEGLALPDGGGLQIIDYQMPLYASNADIGVGAVDLFGVVSGAKQCVIELKNPPKSGGRGDSPLRAFLEALAYCALVEANSSAIASQLKERFGVDVSAGCPALMLLAPDFYWTEYLQHKKTGDWWPPLQALATELQQLLGLQSYFIAMRDCRFDMGLNRSKPRLRGECEMFNVAKLV